MIMKELVQKIKLQYDFREILNAERNENFYFKQITTIQSRLFQTNVLHLNPYPLECVWTNFKSIVLLGKAI